MNKFIKTKSLLIKIFFVAFLSLVTTAIYAQTYNGTGGHILDDGSHNYYYSFVSGLNPANIDTSFGLETVCINLTHTYDDDLVISLIAPDGKEFVLVARNGGGDDNFTNTCFNNSAANSIETGSAPFTGTFRPEGAMAIVNNGQIGNGIWILHILDTYPYADEGDVLNWSLTFGNDPAKPYPFYGTNLPLVIINTNGNPIPDEPKIMAEMKIIDNGPGMWNSPNDSGNVYDGLTGIEQRGNSSGWMAKKSFSIETRNADSSNNSVSLLGMPSESDWVLIANYADKTLMRNFFTYRLYNKMGRWAPRMQYCELMIDGEYQGIYLLGEKIKKDVNRVNIESLSTIDSIFPDISGGYLFKLDWIDGGDVTWSSNFPAVSNSANLKYILDYPKPEYVINPQLNYIKAYVDSMEFVMSTPLFSDTTIGYRKYLDEKSFIDYILLTEFTKNLDGYRISTYFHKNRYGKIIAGPPWDYDLSWGNADFMECYYPGGWSYEIQMSYTDQCPFWWQLFFQDSLFAQHMRCRWEELRLNVFNPVVIKNEIDSVAAMLDSAVNVNFDKWQILGIYVWPNPAPIPHDYAGEIQKLKDWVDMRIAWLDSNLPGVCPYETGFRENQLKTPFLLSIYPNPAKDKITVDISGESGVVSASVYDLQGQLLLQQNIQQAKTDIDLTSLTNGLYIIKFTSQQGTAVKKFIKE